MARTLKVVVHLRGGSPQIYSLRLLDAAPMRPPHLLSPVGYAATWSGTTWVETIPDPFVVRGAAVDDRMHSFSRRDDGLVSIRLPEAAARDRALQIEIFMLAPPGPRSDGELQAAFAAGALPRQRLAVITGGMLRQHPDWPKIEPPNTGGSGCLPLALVAAVLAAIVLIASPLIRWMTKRRQRAERDG